MTNFTNGEQFNDPQTVRILTGVIDALNEQMEIIKMELSRNSATGLDGEYLQDHERWLHQCIIEEKYGFKRDLMTSADMATEAKRANPVIGAKFTAPSIGKTLKKIGCYVQMRISYIDDNEKRVQRRVWVLRDIQNYASSPLDVLADCYESQKTTVMIPLLHKRQSPPPSTPASFL